MWPERLNCVLCDGLTLYWCFLYAGMITELKVDIELCGVSSCDVSHQPNIKIIYMDLYKHIGYWKKLLFYIALIQEDSLALNFTKIYSAVLELLSADW